MILEHDEEVQNELDYPVPTFAGDSTERDGFANLPILLSVVLMEKNLPLAELQAITPGQTIGVPRDAIMNVEIRANQRRFARGELVQIANGQLAVEIHKVWP